MLSRLQVARLMADGNAFFRRYIEYVRDIYDIRHFEYRDDMIDEYQLQYCQKMFGFIVLFPYALDAPGPSMFLTWAFSEQRLAWDAPSSGVNRLFVEPRDEVERIFCRYLPMATLLTATPIATIRNTFVFQDKIIHHWGVAYACATTNFQELERDPDLRGAFIPIRSIPRVCLANSWNKDLILYACEVVERLMAGGRSSEDEIVEQKKYHSRYQFHRKVVKPLLRFGDSALCVLLRRERREKIYQRVRALIEGGSSMVDVSVGDNLNSLFFEKKFDLVVLNDVAWEAMQPLIKNVKHNGSIVGDILFTNEDLLCAPFKEQSFDVVYCRNTLHHLSTVNEVVQALLNFQKWAKKQVIVIDVLDPRYSSNIWDRARDWYYSSFLNDVGNSFLSYHLFADLLRSIFDNAKWKSNLMQIKSVNGDVAIFIAWRLSQED